MKWISNGDPPIYIWKGDTWYNQKNKKIYSVNIEELCWKSNEERCFFTKKTKIMSSS